MPITIYKSPVEPTGSYVQRGGQSQEQSYKSPVSGVIPSTFSPVQLGMIAEGPDSQNVTTIPGSHILSTTPAQHASTETRSSAMHTIFTNQYYVCPGDNVKQLPLGAQPSLGMKPTYDTAKVRTFESRYFYDQNRHGNDFIRFKRHKKVHGRHCNRCMHRKGSAVSSTPNRHGRDGSVRCSECLKETLASRRRRQQPSTPWVSDDPAYLRDRHHQRTYRGPHRLSHESSSVGSRHYESSSSSNSPARRSRLLHTRCRSNSSAMSTKSSLVVVVGHKITGARMHDLKSPLRRKICKTASHMGPASSSKHKEASRHPRSRRRHHRRLVSKSSTSLEDSLCNYHASLRRHRADESRQLDRKTRQHNEDTLRTRAGSMDGSSSLSSKGRPDQFSPIHTTHHYFHHYPELPSHKLNPFPLQTGTLLQRRGEVHGDSIAYKSGYPANPATATQPFDRLKISTLEFGQPQRAKSPKP